MCMLTCLITAVTCLSFDTGLSSRKEVAPDCWACSAGKQEPGLTYKRLHNCFAKQPA